MTDRKLLFRNLSYKGDIGEKCLYTVFDLTFNLSCISVESLRDLATIHKIGVIRNIQIPNKQPVQVTQNVCLDFHLNEVLLSDEFLVVPGLIPSVIIGAATVRKWRIKLNFEDDRVEVDPKVAKMQLI